jgi:hypothetical protein
MVMQACGFQYKSNVVWHKIRNDGGSDGRGIGFGDHGHGDLHGRRPECHVCGAAVEAFDRFVAKKAAAKWGRTWALPVDGCCQRM